MTKEIKTGWAAFEQTLAAMAGPGSAWRGEARVHPATGGLCVDGRCGDERRVVLLLPADLERGDLTHDQRVTADLWRALRAGKAAGFVTWTPVLPSMRDWLERVDSPEEARFRREGFGAPS